MKWVITVLYILAADTLYVIGSFLDLTNDEDSEGELARILTQMEEVNEK